MHASAPHAKTSDMSEGVHAERMILLAAAGALAIFLVGAELWPDRGPRGGIRGIGEGKTVPVDITLVTADVNDLACAANFTVEGARCAFDREGQPWREGGSGALLAPYMTTNNTLLLIPDLFAEPAIARRLEEEPPAGKARDSLRRFIASCKLHAQQKVKDFYVRWTPAAPWGHRSEAWVGRISECEIRETGST